MFSNNPTKTTEVRPSNTPHERKPVAARADILVLSLALLALFIPVAYLEWHAMHQTGGVLVYPLDDTFIHMQLARNLAFSHTWGIYPGAFAAASSSVLYTLILAGCFKIFAVHTAIPLLINCIAGAAILLVVRKWLSNRGASPAVQLTVLLLAVFLTPLPVLIISGMEHTLQCLFSFLFVFSFSDWMEQLDEGKAKNRKLPASVVVYAVLTTGIRYEGLFLIAIACLILLVKRKPAEMLRLGIIGSLPVLAFGLYSLSKGSFILPNSVLVKSENIPLTVSGMVRLATNIIIEKWTFARAGIAPLATQKLLLMLPLAFLAFHRQIKARPSYGYSIAILVLCTLIHLAFAATGWFYRYEAYLIFNSIVVVGLLTSQFGKEWIRNRSSIQLAAAGAVAVLLVLPVFLRSGTAFSKARFASTNIYQQQYQMARFCRKYYDNNVVAANDIGALSFFTHDRVLDLWGLANNDVARSRKKNYWTPAFLDSITRQQHTTVAVVYDSWFSDSLLKRWNKVATWTIPNNVVCGDSIVSFYAIDTVNRTPLRGNLQQFQSTLPAGVRVAYY